MLEPFFGLGTESVLASLSETSDEERGVAYLRAVAKTNGWRSSDAYIISDLVPLPNCKDVYVREYMTAVPHTRSSRKRDSDGVSESESVHARWLHVENKASLRLSMDIKTIDLAVKTRLEDFAKRGEVSIEAYAGPSRLYKHSTWDQSPYLFDYEDHSRRGLTSKHDTDTFTCPSIDDSSIPCRCFECDLNTAPRLNAPKFSSTYKIGAYSLYWRDCLRNRRSAYQEKMTIRGEEYLHPNIFSERIRKLPIKADVLSLYLQCLISPNRNFSGDEDQNSSREDGRRVRTYIVVANEDVDEDSNGNEPVDIDEQTPRTRLEKRNQSETPCTQDIAEKFSASYKRIRALIALALATNVYLHLEGATIALSVVDTSLHEALWIPRRLCKRTGRQIGGLHFPPSILQAPPTRQNVLGCIAHFESGTLQLQPDQFDATLAISSGNSIFVISVLLSDPFVRAPGNVVKRIIGNIGRTGICLLVAPFSPQIRPLGNQYNLVQHASYDGKREDNFRATTLHLSFTDWKLPVETQGLGARTIDQEACFVESVISVLDSGKWVADLDILSIDFRNLDRLETAEPCHGHVEACPEYDYTSLDSWEEFLDDQKNVAFFRAHGNWAARLAAVSILCQKRQGHSFGLLGPEKFCLQCLNEGMYSHESLGKFQSPLPSVCID